MTKTPSGRDDLMDIDIIVKERHTGAFQLGAGYASSLGAQLNVQLNENNFLGYGYKAGLQVEYNQRYKNFLVNFTDPYFNDTWWSVGTDLYYTDSQVNQYIQQNKGIGLRAGHPIFRDRFDNRLYGFIKYKIDDTYVKFDPTQDFSDVLKPESVNGVTSSTTVSVEYDRRDDRMMPSDGMYANASYEFAGIGGDIQFMKSGANFRHYQKLFWDVVFRNNVTYGILSQVGDKEIPFTEYYRLGGPNNLRGFGFRNVGKRQFSEQYFRYLTRSGSTTPADLARNLANVVVGGKQQLYYMTELEFPLAKEANMRGVIFYDIGQAEDDLTGSNFRSDFGFGIRWFSPMGPLRFEFGFPLDRRAEFQEKSNNFQFAVGSPF
jgi:outer membrane protein insertion porin family